MLQVNVYRSIPRKLGSISRSVLSAKRTKLMFSTVTVSASLSMVLTLPTRPLTPSRPFTTHTRSPSRMNQSLIRSFSGTVGGFITLGLKVPYVSFVSRALCDGDKGPSSQFSRLVLRAARTASVVSRLIIPFCSRHVNQSRLVSFSSMMRAFRFA